MIPILTAIIGAIVVIAGAFVARNATHYAAELEAAQRRRDAELADLLEFRDALIEALHATGEYVFVVKHMAVPRDTPLEQYGPESPDAEKRMRHLIPLIGKRERLRNLAIGLLWEDIREAYRPFDELIVLLRDDKLVEALALNEAQPEMANQLVHLIGKRRRELVATYPTSVRQIQSKVLPLRGKDS